MQWRMKTDLSDAPEMLAKAVVRRGLKPTQRKQQITQDYYPDLTVKDIQAAIQYAIALVAAEDIYLSAAPT